MIASQDEKHRHGGRSGLSRDWFELGAPKKSRLLFLPRVRLFSTCGWLICVFLLVTNATVAAQTRAIIVAGLGGEPDYEAEFQRHANLLARRLREVSNDVTLLLGDSVNRDVVQTHVAATVERTGADDALVLMLIGHGSHDGEHFRFNVPGKDFTATELAGWLEPAAAKRQLVVVTGSSSGAVQAVLEQPGRTVITATRSGGERNATVFARYFSEALGADAADVNKDHRITAQEAFSYTVDRVDGHYGSENEMMTEHALANGPESATVLAMLETPTTLNPVTSEDAELLALEQAIAALRADKEHYTQANYYAELQRLLLELAVVASQIENAEEQRP